jgi:hypothetical protein
MPNFHKVSKSKQPTTKLSHSKFLQRTITSAIRKKARIINLNKNWAHSQLGYSKRQWKKKTTKDYFGFLLHLLFHDYKGLTYARMMSC